MERHPTLDAELERRGFIVVQALLARAGPREEALVEGLPGLHEHHWMTRRYVEAWLCQKQADAEQRERRNRLWTRLAAIAAMVAAVIALGAWLFPIPPGR